MDHSEDILPLENQEDQNINDSIRNRPFSRRGVKTAQRDDSKMERPLSRSFSAVSNQESNCRPPSGIARIQGTASRLVSAASHHRGLSRTITPPRLNTQFDVTDRLITQQGLSSRARSSGTGLKGPGKRQILDKRYYEGVLQLKIRELTNEIALLRKETETNHKEREAFMIYDKQNKELATELTALQGTLADYNLVMDKLHTGTEIKDIDDECESLRATNNEEQMKLEQLFTERTQKQQQIRQLEEESEKEKHVANKLVETMSPEMKAKYEELSNENLKLQTTIDELQRELDNITKDKKLMQEQISEYPLKQEAVKLELKLLETEEKRNNLVTEENENNPDNLQEKYLNQIKEDNVEIATMERSMNQLNEELRNCEKQLQQVEEDLEECQSDRHKHYLELRKREETIETFLSTYEETKKQELENLTKLKSEIVRTMNAISKHLYTLPATKNEYNLINTELSQIDDLESNKQTSLFIQYKQKKLYLEKLQILETKLQNESDDLQEQIEKLRSELITYTNLDALKDETVKKRKELLQKKEQFLEIQDSVKEDLVNTKQEYEKIQKELEENETYRQLQALERKLVSVEQDNFALKEYIADKKCEMNYGPVKEKVLEFVNIYNKKLKDKYNSYIQEM